MLLLLYEREKSRFFCPAPSLLSLLPSLFFFRDCDCDFSLLLFFLFLFCAETHEHSVSHLCCSFSVPFEFVQFEIRLSNKTALFVLATIRSLGVSRNYPRTTSKEGVPLRMPGIFSARVLACRNRKIPLLKTKIAKRRG